MAPEKKTGLSIPPGILQPTTAPPEPPAAEQGGDAPEPAAPEPRSPRARRKRPATPAGKVEGRRLYLSEGVHFRLRMLAYQRGQKISDVAEEVLDKALPKWDVNRVG